MSTVIAVGIIIVNTVVTMLLLVKVVCEVAASAAEETADVPSTSVESVESPVVVESVEVTQTPVAVAPTAEDMRTDEPSNAVVTAPPDVNGVSSTTTTATHSQVLINKLAVAGERDEYIAIHSEFNS